MKRQFQLSKHPDDNGKYLARFTYEFAQDPTLAVQAMHYIFVIDDSGSMDGANFETAKKAVQQLVQEHLNPQDHISLVRFDHSASTLITCEKKQTLDLNMLDFELSGGGTDFNEAFEQIANILKCGPGAEFGLDATRIALLTDGQGRPEHTPEFLTQMISSAEGACPNIISIGIGVGYNQAFVQKIGNLSGVEPLFHATSDTLLQTFELMTPWLSQSVAPGSLSFNGTTTISIAIHPGQEQITPLLELDFNGESDEQTIHWEMTGAGENIQETQETKRSQLNYDPELIKAYYEKQLATILNTAAASDTYSKRQAMNAEKIHSLQKLQTKINRFNAEQSQHKDICNDLLLRISQSIEAAKSNNEEKSRQLSSISSLMSSSPFSSSLNCFHPGGGFSVSAMPQPMARGLSTTSYAPQPKRFINHNVNLLQIEDNASLSYEYYSEQDKKELTLKIDLNALYTELSQSPWSISGSALAVNSLQQQLSSWWQTIKSGYVSNHAFSELNNLLAHDAVVGRTMLMALLIAKHYPKEVLAANASLKLYRNYANSGEICYWLIFRPEGTLLENPIYVIDLNFDAPQLITLTDDDSRKQLKQQYIDEKREGALSTILVPFGFKPTDIATTDRISQEILDGLSESDLKEIDAEYTLYCPINQDLMTQPVRIDMVGISPKQIYDYQQLQQWFEGEAKSSDPLTNVELKPVRIKGDASLTVFNQKDLLEIIEKAKQRKKPAIHPVTGMEIAANYQTESVKIMSTLKKAEDIINRYHALYHDKQRAEKFKVPAAKSIRINPLSFSMSQSPNPCMSHSSQASQIFPSFAAPSPFLPSRLIIPISSLSPMTTSASSSSSSSTPVISQPECKRSQPLYMSSPMKSSFFQRSHRSATLNPFKAQMDADEDRPTFHIPGKDEFGCFGAGRSSQTSNSSSSSSLPMFFSPAPPPASSSSSSQAAEFSRKRKREEQSEEALMTTSQNADVDMPDVQDDESGKSEARSPSPSFRGFE